MKTCPNCQAPVFDMHDRCWICKTFVPEPARSMQDSVACSELVGDRGEPRARTLLRSMIAALDRGDSDTYWMVWGQLLAVHAEMMRSPTRKDQVRP